MELHHFEGICETDGCSLEGVVKEIALEVDTSTPSVQKGWCGACESYMTHFVLVSTESLD